MQYPGTSSNFMTGADDGDTKKKLVDMLSQRLQAAPSFGGAGRSTSDLPQVGSPAISYNPFLAMLAGRPGETFNNLPQGISSALAGGIQAGPGPIQGGGAQGDPNAAGFTGSSIATTTPNQNLGPADGLTSHPLFDQSAGAAAPQPTGGNVSAFNNVGGDIGPSHGLGQQFFPGTSNLQQLIAYSMAR